MEEGERTEVDDEAHLEGEIAGCESTIAQDDGGCEIADEIETAIRHAAGKQRVVRIRLKVGRRLSVSKAVLAGILHRRFPHASVEMAEGKDADTVVVRDIEVE